MNEWIKGNVVSIIKGWGWAFLVQLVVYFLAAIAAFATGTGRGKKWLMAILGGLLSIVVGTGLVSDHILPSEKPVESVLPLSTSTQVVSMVPVPTKDLTPIVIRVITPIPTTTSTPTLTPTPTPTHTPSPSNHAPTDLTLDNYDVEENRDDDTQVGTFSTTDPDADDSYTYTLVSGMEYFSIVGNILQTAHKFNFERKNNYRIEVRTTDDGGLSFEKSFTIEVIDVNDPPELTPISNRFVTVGDLLTFTANAIDEDGNALVFSLSGAPTDAGIDPRTGEFSWIPSSTGTFNVTLIVTETDGHPEDLSDRETIVITVNAEPIPTPPCYDKQEGFYFEQPVFGAEISKREYNNSMCIVFWLKPGMYAKHKKYEIVYNQGDPQFGDWESISDRQDIPCDYPDRSVCERLSLEVKHCFIIDSLEPGTYWLLPKLFESDDANYLIPEKILECAVRIIVKE